MFRIFKSSRVTSRFSINFAAVLIVLFLGACSSELSDEEAKRLAISKYTDIEVEKLKAYSDGLNPVSRSSIARVKEATVLQNDGTTARVKLEISLKKSLPSDFIEIEVTKAQED